MSAPAPTPSTDAAVTTTGTGTVKRGLAEMLKGGVIMDVVTPEQARIGDLVVMFSFSKLSQEGKMILGYRKEAGYQTLAFISRAFVPEEERADIQLFAYRGEAKEYHSMTAAAALVDALVVAVSEQMGEASVENLSHLYHMKKTYAPNR